MNHETIEGEVQSLAVRENYAPAEWTPSFVRSVDDQLAMLRERDRFYREVLKEGVHYGIIPGTQKPSLWKPGAEALCSGMALHAETGNEEPPIVDVTGADHNGEPFIQYVRFCSIYRQTGPTKNERVEVAKLVGACNSWEPKYRYRNAQRVCPECGKPTIIKAKDFSGQDRDLGFVCWKKSGKSDGCGKTFPPGDESIASQTAGKVPNEDVAELQNTILKMADKRALIAATLVATGCSDIFTQDVEDMPATVKRAASKEVMPNEPSRNEQRTQRDVPIQLPDVHVGEGREGVAPQPDREDTPENRARGIKACHSLARSKGIDLESSSSPYRRILLEDFPEVFSDPKVEISSKALSYPQLRLFYKALQTYIDTRPHA